jgi:2-C-methyl-D-erythritol 4-phosphate cytidylyltransferase
VPCKSLEDVSEAPRSDAPGTAGSATWVVLVAAGAGSRLGAERPKAFVGLGGRPLLAESLERLDRSPWVDAIVVASPPGWEEPAILVAEELVASKVSSVVTGGATRAESVRAAVAEVPLDALVVVVHDAARPLVDDLLLERVLAPLAEGVDGVVPALPLADTVKRVERGLVVETVDRELLVAVQTPQAFLAAALRGALAGDVRSATDCASLVERRGGRIRVVDGDPRLFKVTTPADLDLVERLLGEP